MGIVIGRDTLANIGRSVVIGDQATASGGNEAVAIGGTARATASNTTAVGDGANASVAGAHVFGNRATASATCSVAIGYDVDATRADTTVSRQYEACVNGKGIVVTSPDGLTTLGIGIDNTGAIVTYTP